MHSKTPPQTQFDAIAKGLALGVVTLSPASLTRSLRCTTCRSHIRSGQALFVDAPATYIATHGLGSHLCLACGERAKHV